MAEPYNLGERGHNESARNIQNKIFPNVLYSVFSKKRFSPKITEKREDSVPE